jgi:hypothetical protein
MDKELIYKAEAGKGVEMRRKSSPPVVRLLGGMSLASPELTF